VNLISPVSPETMNWHPHFPQFFNEDGSSKTETVPKVEFADIGCGYGGLLGIQSLCPSLSFVC
jgi:tRNA (guanine-N7-)-methyltransferase